VSVLYPPSLSIVAASAVPMRPATRTPARAERALVQNALGPDERLLAMLHGSDASGSVTWLATNVRLVMLSHAAPDEQIATERHAAITCVEQRTDPVGTWVRVRATGHQYSLTNVDATAASQFCAVLRERAGIGASAIPSKRPAPARDALRTVFTGQTAQSPR
jgi:hypothetical protein